MDLTFGTCTFFASLLLTTAKKVIFLDALNAKKVICIKNQVFFWLFTLYKLFCYSRPGAKVCSYLVGHLLTRFLAAEDIAPSIHPMFPFSNRFSSLFIFSISNRSILKSCIQ